MFTSDHLDQISVAGSGNSEESMIPVEREDYENDSAYGGEYAQSTASITDSIRDFRELHGRTYQNFKESEYWAPNDEGQSDQLDILHHVMTMLLDGKLFLAPLQAPMKVIDIGTGTGIWAIDFADAYPTAEVIGTDLSDTMPQFVPPNCRFELDDAELEWTFPLASFDYVHIRYMMGSIRDWPGLYTQAYNAIKPGGWIEHMESSVIFESDDGTITPELERWGPLQNEACEKMGKSFIVAVHTKERLQAAGFVDVREHKFKLPIGPWSSNKKMREIGAWNLYFFLRDIEGFCIYLLGKVLGWAHADVIAWVTLISKALQNPRIHVYYRSNVVYGRKPGGP